MHFRHNGTRGKASHRNVRGFCLYKKDNDINNFTLKKNALKGQLTDVGLKVPEHLEHLSYSPPPAYHLSSLRCSTC